MRRTTMIGLMALGSIAMWLVVPVLWLYLASHMVKSSQPSLGPYVVVLVGIPASMVVIGKLLSALNRQYGRRYGAADQVRAQLPWQKSLRGERGSTRQRTILDVVMVTSVGIALLAFGIWFFFFAGSSLPG